MRVFGISLINNANSVIPISVSSTRVNASNPSFGFLFTNRQKDLINRYLPRDRRKIYDAEFVDAFKASDPKVATDNVMIRALREAKVCRVLAFLAKIPSGFGGFVGMV